MILSRSDVKFFKMSVGNENIGKENDNDIVAKCPICGDSAKKKNLKRLHLYVKNNKTRINCFNGDCSAKNKTMYSFLRDFYPSLFDQYKRENFQLTMDKLSNSENLDVFSSFKEEEKDEADCDIITQDLSPYMTPISESKEALDYVKSRAYNYNQEYGKWYFGHQNLEIGGTVYNIINSIVIPLYYNNQMYGFYSRNISKKDFSTYMNEKNIGYKIAFWFNIDKAKPVYIAEGVFDALSIGNKNCIALLGAKLPLTRLKELKEPIFVLDNDKTGILNSIQYAKAGYKVYIQPDKYKEKDMNSLKLNHPELDIEKLINDNLFWGISAETRLKNKL